MNFQYQKSKQQKNSKNSTLWYDKGILVTQPITLKMFYSLSVFRIPAGSYPNIESRDSPLGGSCNYVDETDPKLAYKKSVFKKKSTSSTATVSKQKCIFALQNKLFFLLCQRKKGYFFNCYAHNSQYPFFLLSQSLVEGAESPMTRGSPAGSLTKKPFVLNSRSNDAAVTSSGGPRDRKVSKMQMGMFVRLKNAIFSYHFLPHKVHTLVHFFLIIFYSP